MNSPSYPHPNYTRFAEETLQEALEDSPVILIHGSRQCGKTTLAQSLGEKLGYHYISFDNINQLQAAAADPSGFIKRLPECVILDEIQRTPELLSTIKLTVDQNRKPGRFILTGSSNVLALPQLSDSLAGRMEIIHLRPLSQSEIANQKPNFLAWLWNDDFDEHPLAHTTRKRKGDPQTYRHLGQSLADIICQGGYPAAIVRKSEKRRSRWYRDYITTIVQRDVQDIANIHHLDILPKLLSLTATQTARLFVYTNLAAPFSISRPTIREYLALLEQIFLIEQLEPWHSNRLRRLIKTPKVHITDTGLACALLGVSSEALSKDKTLLGQMLETFVYQELRKHADWHDEDLRFYHFRNKDKVEVDIIIEKGLELVGIEIKATATVRQSDFKGLIKLRDAYSKKSSANESNVNESSRKQFVRGIVFYDGEHILPFGEKLLAVPISILTPAPIPSQNTKS